MRHNLLIQDIAIRADGMEAFTASVDGSVGFWQIPSGSGRPQAFRSVDSGGKLRSFAQAGNDHPTIFPMGTYRTADGHINIAAMMGCPGGSDGPASVDNSARTASERTSIANRSVALVHADWMCGAVIGGVWGSVGVLE